MITGGVEKVRDAGDIGGDKRIGAVDRSIDMGFGRQIQDAGVGMTGKNPVEKRAVENVSFDEFKAWVPVGAVQVLAVAGVGQFVQDGEFFKVIPVEKFSNKSGADKAGATGEEDGS